jgi:putative peptidoglycan binding protein
VLVSADARSSVAAPGSSLHVVQPGEHLSAIAVRHGFDSYKSLWHRDENAGLRAQRKNPNVLLAGDQVVVPDRSVREELRPTDQRHRFVVERPPLRLRIRLLDERHRAVFGVTATLTVDGTEYPPHLLGGDGQVDERIVNSAAAGRLTVNPRAAIKRNVSSVRSAGVPAPAPESAVTPSGSPSAPAPEAARPADAVGAPVSPEPREPGCENEISPLPVETPPPDQRAPAAPAESNAPALAPADSLQLFRPELSGLARINATWVELDLTLGIGELDPIDTISGQLQRLHNLGYEPGPVSPATNDDERRRQRSAIEEFQCDQSLGVDGVCGPVTQAKLLQVHGC